jgi:hypothetical protein
MAQTKERKREYMRFLMTKKRHPEKGAGLELARKLYNELIGRGVCKSDARWAVLDAFNRGCINL